MPPFVRISKAEAALLEWVNTFPLGVKVETLIDLTDGFVFAKMLADMNSKYAVHVSDISTSSSKWITKKNSLESVYKSLLRYISDKCDAVEPLVDFKDTPDFNAIAEHDDKAHTTKLLTIFLLAAINGEKNIEYVTKITHLDPDTQATIAEIIQTIQPENLSANTDEVPTPLTKDGDLALEEQNAALFSEYETLKKKHADFITRFERLQSSHDDLLQRTRDTEHELVILQDAANANDQTQYIKALRSQILEANNLIANQEQQLEMDRVTKENQERELRALRVSAARLIEVEDELKEVRIENKTLTKKANTLDHFQWKLEAHSGIEKENATLRERVGTLQENQKFYDQMVDEVTTLKTTVKEYGKRFQSHEIEIVTLGNQKKTLEEEIRQRDTEIQILTARKLHDEKFIQDLQEQFTSSNPSNAPRSPSSLTLTAKGLTLEEELAQSSEPNYALEISRLRAENQLLKSSTAGTDNATLRIDLEESLRARKRLEENLQGLTEKYTIGQHQLNAALSGSAGEKNEAIAHTNKLYMEIKQELSITNTKLGEVQAELTSRDRDLLAAKADLAAIDREEIEALDDLKAVNEIITTSFQQDLLHLQNDHKNLTTDFEQQKSHLIDALLSKDRLMQDLSILRERMNTEKLGGQTDEELALAALENQKSKEQIEKQDLAIQDLQRRLKIAEEASPDTLKAANESMIKNLTRENALIASAWYDLSSRLQSNHVVLQRRQDAPKSWLNKQRQMVTSSSRR